jgi:hypothetical protein
MSVPSETRAVAASKEVWRTVRYALESNARTARFCVIIAVAAMAWWLITRF